MLLALAAREADAVVVVDADGDVCFYSTAAAAGLLRLPLPAERLPLAELLAAHPGVGRDGRPARPGTSPIEVALAERRHVTGELCDVGPDGSLRIFNVSATPYLDGAGAFLGVAACLTLWRESPADPGAAALPA